jgi:streptomycin 6-kinase
VPSDDAFPTDSDLFVHISQEPGGPHWLAGLPARVARLEERWGATTRTPFTGGSAAWVAPAVLHDGRAAVLKVSWPHPEARAEAAALAHWNGQGSAALFEYDADAWAILMEHCLPGTTLTAQHLEPRDSLTESAMVLRRLWSVPPPPIGTIHDLGQVTREWASLVRERMAKLSPGYDQGLVELGASLLESLPAATHQSVVVHGDFNPGNILATDRQGWAAIDPKPMIGDPCYDPAPLLLQVDPPFDAPSPARVLLDRVEHVAGILNTPADRILAWIVARSVEWALWYASRGGLEDGRAGISVARTAATLAGL